MLTATRSNSLFCFIMLVFSLSTFCSASDQTDGYLWLYKTARNADERLNLIDEVREAELDDAGRFYADALQILLVEKPRYLTNSERKDANTIASQLARLLGETKQTSSGPDLWKCFQNFDDPSVKAEALLALGRIQALEQLPLVVRLLADLNLQPGIDPTSTEIIAYGAILSLESYAEPSAYLALFQASVAWYSERVKSRATKALSAITTDPAPVLTPIIPIESSEIGKAALERISASTVSSKTAKSNAATIALNTGWNRIPVDIKTRIALANLRKTAIASLVSYGSSEATVPSLAKSFKNGIDFEEKTGALSVLAKNTSEAAVKTLYSFLDELNAKSRAGAINTEDERLVRALINSCGENGAPGLRAALRDVRYSGWTSAVSELAREAEMLLR